MQREVLGRGIKALIPEIEVDTTGQVTELSLDDLRPGSCQPREIIDPEALNELAVSLREQGVVQPVVVRPMGEGYELIVGERRWRAARIAGYKTIPAIIKDVGDRDALEIALVENTQRQDLNPMEEANAFQRLSHEYDLTHDQIATKLGKDRSYVSNVLRLLKLPQVVKGDLMAGRLTMGHAKAILACREKDRLELRDLIIEKSLSVREAEGLTRLGKQKKKRQKREPSGSEALFVASLEESLRQMLGTKVKLNHGKRGGRLEIFYYSQEELERVVEILRDGSS